MFTLTGNSTHYDGLQTPQDSNRPSHTNRDTDMYTDFTFWDEPRWVLCQKDSNGQTFVHTEDGQVPKTFHEDEDGTVFHEIKELKVGVIADVVGGYAPRYNPPGKAHPGAPAEAEVELFWIIGGERREMHEADFGRLCEEAQKLALEGVV